MKRHCITLCRGNSIQEDREYLDIINAYNGIGGSAPELDDELMGKGYRVFIESEEPPTVEQLQRDFSALSILEISEMPTTSDAQPS